MTQSNVGVSVVSSIVAEVPTSSVLEPSLARLLPPLRFRATPLPCPGEEGESPFNSGPNSISDGVPLDEMLVGRGRREDGMGRL